MSKLSDIIANPTLDNLKSYVYTQCERPVTISYTDKTDGACVIRNVPCGSCIHCQQSKQNEWVTRLTHHALDNEFVYFVTLTYASVEPCMQDLLDGTYPIRCANNSRGTVEYRPSLLCRSHLQKFLKRLRFRLPDNKITFYACGEYGDTYLRPHYHLILFSDKAISRNDIVRAWSYDCVKNSDGIYRARHGFDKSFVTIPIGNIDFADLRKNGTLANKALDSKHSANYVFKYVCKYVGKKSLSDKLDKYLTNMFNLINAPFYEQTNEILSKLESVYTKDGEMYKQSKLFIDERLVPSYSVFLRRFMPYHVCSLKTPIGIGYALANAERFAKQDFTIEKVNGEDLVFPAYYLRKTKEIINPYFTVDAVSGSSKRATVQNLAVFQNVAMFIRNSGLHFSDCLKNNSDTSLRTLAHEGWTIYDKVNKLRYVFNDMTMAYDILKYNPKSKEYDTFPYSLTFEEMLCKVYNPTLAFILFQQDLSAKLLLRLNMQDNIKELYTMQGIDYDAKFVELWTDIVASHEKLQQSYKSKKRLS